MIEPIMLLPGALVGAGVAVIIAVLIPAPPALGNALERLTPVSASSPGVVTSSDGINERIGSALLRQTTGIPGFTLPEVDLRLIGLAASHFMTRKALFAGLFFLLPLTAGLILQTAGAFSIVIPAALTIPFGIGGWFLPNLIVKGEAAEARAEFSRAVAVYLELVASERTRSAPTRALEAAAAVGRSWVFIRISQELSHARYAGIAAWDGLERLSKEIDVPDLAELARRMRLSGEEGASVYETLRAQGRSLRNRLLNEQQTEANKSTSRMVIPMAMTGFVFLLLIGTPFVLDAFL